ncbi:hypothetical protein RM550_22940 [Streptomyces sp. DSM 41527]|uniref:Secreted protein n=1 Tax=Streptomyces mooreae TaxID=3075523 RepID=A0ABU2TC81_9ACTN|nr:hypothetical protein [Streptomyces sp. DSM 41527]MDT0458555.1 hypothetical protein [Streptomyces sp. DSM 41527]
MTEFTTALVAGLIGLVGTMAGGAATAWAAKISAHKNAEAVRRQVQDQAESEHAHWLRQQRLAAYEGFLDAWDECTHRRTELTRPVDDSAHDALRGELSRSASRMMERARRISLLGPEEVSLAAEAISRATQENIEKEDKYGQYVKSALLQAREHERQIRELSPPAQSDDLKEVLRHADDLERLQGLYSVEQLDGIVGQAERSVNEMEELRQRMAAFAEFGRDFNDRAESFLQDFRRNIEVAESSRTGFAQTVRKAIATPH